MLGILSVVLRILPLARRSSALDYQDIHRESGDAVLIKTAGFAAYIAALKDGALRRNWVTAYGPTKSPGSFRGFLLPSGEKEG